MLICTFSFMEKSNSERKLDSPWGEKKKKKDKLEKPQSPFKTKPCSSENKLIK